MSTATKIDFFDAITLGLFGFLAILVVVEVLFWVADKVRDSLFMRRLRRRGEQVRWLPRPNAGFSLRKRSSAARRHFDHEDELGMLTQQGWGQMRHRTPPADSGSRHLREPD